MTLHVLVEGSSEYIFLEAWLPRLQLDLRLRVHPHQGKGKLLGRPALPHERGLLDQLPGKLRGFSGTLDPLKDGVLVLVDADDDDPNALREAIEILARAQAPELRVDALLAVEETEAFYLGDLRALRRAFPKANHPEARAYDPDCICGTWELFGRVVHDDGGNKVAWAEAMGPIMTLHARESRSPSFRTLVKALQAWARPKKVVTLGHRLRRHPPKPRSQDGKRR